MSRRGDGRARRHHRSPSGPSRRLLDPFLDSRGISRGFGVLDPAALLEVTVFFAHALKIRRHRIKTWFPAGDRGRFFLSRRKRSHIYEPRPEGSSPPPVPEDGDPARRGRGHGPVGEPAV
ncbi:protein of unknown function [Methanoculleus bourgensis]|uniref:Uncharacterized protein n=1 Tax=Methanoculleus bourgensis TaxID=83986 RepID=A0A0X3BI74_9EURY|nr:protein of unknown function [Methanoculleus bourgensis]